jgi:predicted RNase H-like HicB family nuclease
MKRPREYQCVLEPQAEGGFLAYLPDLPDVASEGETREEALANVQEALKGYLTTMERRGWPLPEVERDTVLAP